MHYFVTGAGGWIGSAVVKQLVAAGHSVSGLARSDKSAQAIESAGGTVVRGDLDDVELLMAEAAASDGVAHLGFDFSKYAAACILDIKAIEAMGGVLAGTNKPLVVTSGTAMVGNSAGRVAVESDVASDNPGIPRKSEATALAQVPLGVRAMVVRLPPTVHGTGDQGTIAVMIKIARKTGASAYVNSGTNRIPATHVLDAASVYVAALAKGKAGAVYHAVSDDGVPVLKVAELISSHLGVPLVSKAAGDEAVAHFGFIGRLLALDNPSSSVWTQEHLGVAFTGVGLLEDIELGHYFEA